MKPHTESVCPVCLKRIPAQRTERDGNIYLEKTCPEHGFFQTLIWEGKPDYQSWGKAPRATRVLSDERVQRGCPYDCGLCSQHRQRSCCVLLEVTQRCNLGCPVCFAEAGREDKDPDLHTIEGWFDRLRELAPKANIQLSGGGNL